MTIQLTYENLEEMLRNGRITVADYRQLLGLTPMRTIQLDEMKDMSVFYANESKDNL